MNPGTTATATAAVTDSANAVNGDWPIVWASLHPTIATVSPAGVITGVASGTDTVTATAGGVADSVAVTVATTGPTSTVVTPTPDTLFSVNDSLALTAKSYIGVTPTAGTYTWVSRDPTVVTVNANGLVVAVANGTTYVVATESQAAPRTRRASPWRSARARSASTPTPVQRYVGHDADLRRGGDGCARQRDPGRPLHVERDRPERREHLGDRSRDDARHRHGHRESDDRSGGREGAAYGEEPDHQDHGHALAGVTLAAFGRTVTDTAIAYDTLSKPMTGVTFTWASSNPGVATVPGTAGATQVATAVGNGTTAISASAQGTTGSATLNVAQVLFSIVAGPTPIAVGPGGSAQLTARGQDSTAHFMPGGTFTWTSGRADDRDRGRTTGVITAVALRPTARKVWATSGTIVSDTGAREHRQFRAGARLLRP